MLYRHLNPDIVRYFRGQEPGEAEDLAAETWVSLRSALRRFQGDEAAFRAWVFTIARRRLIDYRKRWAARTSLVSAVGAALEQPAPNDTERNALTSVTTDEVLAHVEGLPRDQARVILLGVLGQLSAEEVGLLIGKPPAAVRALQHRALERLAKQSHGKHHRRSR